MKPKQYVSDPNLTPDDIARRQAYKQRQLEQAARILARRKPTGYLRRLLRWLRNGKEAAR